MRYRWLEATSEVPRLLVDTTMASLNELARRGTGGRVAPIRIELARRDRDRSTLQRHFGCPVVFEASHDAMVFDRADLDVPFVTSAGGAFALVVEGLEQRLAEGEGFSGLVGELRRRGTGVLLMPSRTDGELFALRCPKLDRPRPGNGFLVHRGELTELQVAQVAAPAPSRPDGPGDESSCTESG